MHGQANETKRMEMGFDCYYIQPLHVSMNGKQCMRDNTSTIKIITRQMKRDSVGLQ